MTVASAVVAVLSSLAPVVFSAATVDSSEIVGITNYIFRQHVRWYMPNEMAA